MKNKKYHAVFQPGQLTEQPKTLDDLGRFDLKMFRNCPIRIKIITARGKIFGIKCQPNPLKTIIK
jgi:hypothetical protein